MHIHLTGEKVSGAEGDYTEIMAENFPVLTKGIWL